MQMYFMMTSLSTVGFGDYYPINNLERLFGSIILLSGVTVFSYIMMKLADMIVNFNELTGDSSNDSEIESFLLLLRKFNEGFPLKASVQQDIREFLKLSCNYDKLNFLKTESDNTLLQKLPANIQTKIYTDFLF